MVGALDPGASGLGSSPSRGHCVVFLGKTLKDPFSLTVMLCALFVVKRGH